MLGPDEVRDLLAAASRRQRALEIGEQVREAYATGPKAKKVGVGNDVVFLWSDVNIAERTARMAQAADGRQRAKAKRRADAAEKKAAKAARST